MANEYLRRTPTSTGNRKVWTFSCWIKINSIAGAARMIFAAGQDGNNRSILYFGSPNGTIDFYQNSGGVAKAQVSQNDNRRDFSSWMHILAYNDTTKTNSFDGIKIFVNGIQSSNDVIPTYTKNFDTWVNSTNIHSIGEQFAASAFPLLGELTDVFLVDGQALTPDVFGFYKQGKGYISVGSTQATDFRPGQWVPKKPRIITTEINRRGGFGVNGFYLPMNDSNNFGADFHCTPNSIIKLQENLPQPKCRIDGVGDYSGSLRDDPFKQYLVLALPFVSGGLQSGFGDYSAAIKGSGSAKTVTRSGNVAVATTSSFYGSAAYFTNNAKNDVVDSSPNTDFTFGTGDFTVEFWARVIGNGSNSTFQTLFDCRTTDTPSGGFVLGATNPSSGSCTVKSYGFPGGTGDVSYISFGQNDWVHYAAVRKGTTQSLYINGVAVAIYTNVSSNYTQGGFRLGAANSAVGTGDYNFNGYIQDLRVYKGVAKYTGGFDVPKPYTPVGIATWRAVPDSTANNFCTWNPLSAFDGAQTNGNLTSTTNDLMGTVGVSTGKWYWEIYDTTAVGVGGNVMHHGVSFGNYNRGVGGGFSNAPEGILIIRLDATNQTTSGTTVTITSQTGTVPTYSNGDIYAIALDLDLGQVRHYRNGSVILTTNFTYNKNTYAIPFTRNNGLSCSANFGQNPTFSGNTTAGTFTDSNGKGLFKYQPPSGFLALCEDNLPTPAIADPGKHFKTVLYTGDGNSGRSITGIGFTPDLVWIKNRISATWHIINDSVRGPNRALYSNQTYAENQTASNPVLGSVLSFNSDGFSLAVDPDSNGNNGWNNSGSPIVAWCWRAGAGTTSTNTNGSITSVVSVNQDAGFSIVSYTGNGTIGATVGHGLNKKPKFFMTKNRDTAGLDWPVFSAELLGSNGYIYLNKTNAAATIVNVSAPTSSVLTLSGYNDNNKSGDRFIAYCWAEIDGFSKFGSYNGNSSTDGVFVYTGHRPAFVMIKRTDSTGNWVMHDNARNSTNPAKGYLLANSSGVEEAGNDILDFLSNGFKIRNTWTDINASGGSYVFASFAESPFQTANSK